MIDDDVRYRLAHLEAAANDAAARGIRDTETLDEIDRLRDQLEGKGDR